MMRTHFIFNFRNRRCMKRYPSNLYTSLDHTSRSTPAQNNYHGTVNLVTIIPRKKPNALTHSLAQLILQCCAGIHLKNEIIISNVFLENGYYNNKMIIHCGLVMTMYFFRVTQNIIKVRAETKKKTPSNNTWQV